jgi:hypothetical protein
MKKIFFIAAAASVMITQTGCFGGFELTKKVWDFNDSLVDNKVVKTLIFWVFNIVPVYGIAGFLDAVIFNLIEFWSGSNPLAMVEGQSEEQFANIKGEDFKITATKNKMSFQKIDGDALVDMGEMIFSEENSTWSFVKDGVSKDLISINLESNTVDYNTLQGVQSIDMSNMDCIVLNDKMNATPYAMK